MSEATAGRTAGAPDAQPDAADPLGTAAIRHATLRAWTSSPTRLREDANVEADHAAGYYRDRAVVELAQNAADAWTALGDPRPAGGRLLLRLARQGEDDVLTAANTGAPLSAAGVLALSSMRASAKVGAGAAAPAAVGRFGVGFAAVRALADEIEIGSAAGGVQFSATRARELLRSAFAHAAVPDPVLGRPSADLPLLRLPFATPPPTPVPGYDTVVVAHLRGPREAGLVRAMLAEVDDSLLLALPALAEIRVEVDGEPARVLADVGRRWRSVRVDGAFDPADLRDRPYEERLRTHWSICCALPRERAGAATALRRPGVLHAPTPTDEQCTLPALLVATFPLDPSRRHVAPGPATQALAEAAGRAYAELARAVADDTAAGGPGGAAEDVLALVPTGPPQGWLDALVRAAALEAMRRAPLLHPVAPDDPPVAPAHAQAVAGPVGHDPRALAALAPLVPGLVAVPRGAAARERLRTLGLEPRDLADVVEALPTALPPERWREVYDALAAHVDEPGVLDALAELPVPLVDGRMVRGARGVVLPAGAVQAGSRAGRAAEDLGPLGLRVADPAAAHPLLARLGALAWDPAALLAGQGVREAVEAAAEGALPPEQVEPVVDAVLSLVEDAVADGLDPDEVARACPALAGLPLPADDGERVPARDLSVPGTWAARVLDALRPVDAALVDRYGPAVLAAAGVRDTLRLVRLDDVVASDPDAGSSRHGTGRWPGSAGAAAGEDDAAPDGWSAYLEDLAEALGPGAYVGEVVAVADLDAVAPDAWPDVVRMIADDPRLRAALAPVRANGRTAPSYTSWWLQDLLDAPFAAPGAEVPFLPPAPAAVRTALDGRAQDPELLTALGAVADLTQLDRAGWERCLALLPPEGATLAIEDAVALWRGLAAAAARPGLRLSPDRLPVLRAGPGERRVAVVAPAAQVLVATEPMWAQVADVLPAPDGQGEALADALDVDLLEEDDADVAAQGAAGTPTPAQVLRLLPSAPRTYEECDDLSVDGVPVEWWVANGTPYAATTAGLARALARAAGAWHARGLVEAVLADPGRADDLSVEMLWERP